MFVVLMEGVAGGIYVVMVEEYLGSTGIFGQDVIHGFQGFHGSIGYIAEIADGGRDQVQNAAHRAKVIIIS